MFKLADNVKVLVDSRFFGIHKGEKGTILNIVEGLQFPIWVKMGDTELLEVFKSEELELVKE